MGIRGLQGYLSANPGNARPFELHNTYLVIDARNYVSHYYRKSGLAFHYGGELLDFVNCLRDFLRTLVLCHIKPIFVFDGCHEASGSKNTTLQQRLKDGIDKLESFLREAGNSPDIDKSLSMTELIPLLIIEVLIKLLDDYGFYHVSSEREADKQTAELAAYLNCPILSDDSDFCLFQSPTHFEQCKVVSITSLGKVCSRRSSTPCGCSDSPKCRSLPCLVFNQSESSLKTVSPSLRPLISVLVGNDIIKDQLVPNRMGSLFRAMRGNGKSYSFNKISAAIQWLVTFADDTEAAVKELLSEVLRSGTNTSFRLILECVQSYQLKPTRGGRELADFLQLPPERKHATEEIQPRPTSKPSASNIVLLTNVLNCTNPDEPEIDERDKVSLGWPTALTTAYRQGILSSYTLNPLYVTGGRVVGLLYEDLSINRSIHVVTEKIRRLQYGLLVHLERNINKTEKLVGLVDNQVKETSRSGCSIVSSYINVPQIRLEEGHTAEQRLRQFFITHLSLDLQKCGNAPYEDRTMATTLAYWCQNSSTMENSEKLRNNPAVLAHVTCAVVTQYIVEPLLNDNEMLTEAFSKLNTHQDGERCTVKFQYELNNKPTGDKLSQLSKHYANLGEEFKMHCQYSSKKGYSIRVVHQFNELKLISNALNQLIMLHDLLEFGIQPAMKSNGTMHASISPWVQSPSGRLHHWLARSIESVSPSERWDKLYHEWIPQLCSFGGVQSSVDVVKVSRKIKSLLNMAEQLLEKTH